jgi:hypothetical protein
MHLSRIRGRELPHFQIDKNMTPQQPVIKDQIDSVMRIIKSDPLLPRLETKTPPHLLCLVIGYVKGKGQSIGCQIIISNSLDIKIRANSIIIPRTLALLLLQVS